MCDITAEMPDTMDGILYQARNFRLSSGTGAAYLVQLLKHLPISIEVCNANLALTILQVVKRSLKAQKRSRHFS